MNANTHHAAHEMVEHTCAQFEREGHPMCSNPKAWSVSLPAVVPALDVFTKDSIRVVAYGERVFRDRLPTQFNWTLPAMTWLLMAARVVNLCRHLPRRRAKHERFKPR